MHQLTLENLRDYLVSHGRLAPAGQVELAWLSGGVSNLVMMVIPSDRPAFVVKQSQAQLRTRADWFSRLDRIYREIEAQRACARLLPDGVVPEVLFEDRENYCYAMSAIRPDHAVWKQQLLAGIADVVLFGRAGELLGRLHAGSAGQTGLLSAPADRAVFYELRVDPFYRRIASVHPQIFVAVERLIAGMDQEPRCLVHADFSPKNLLVHPDGLSLVDYETVHYGDPAFDLGFFFSHLWLKALALTASRPAIIAGIRRAWHDYQQQVLAAAAFPSAVFDGISRRAVLHLAGCLLSRVDGKSPVDYLTRPDHQDCIRRLTLDWWQHPPADLDHAHQHLESLFTAEES